MKRALSVSNLLNKQYKLFEFTDEWYEAFGRPARTGVWFVYAGQGQGKTSFMIQLAKYLAGFERVVYNSLEEGSDHTLQQAFNRMAMQDVGRKVTILEADPLAIMEQRMQCRKAAKVWIIDTVQYLEMDWAQYVELKRRHSDKLIIFTSHMEGGQPDGKLAMKILRDAALKIYISGFVAISKGRYVGPTGKYIIWDKEARAIWGDKI